MTQILIKVFESIGRITVSTIKLSILVFVLVGIAALLFRVGAWAWALVMGF